ncbi:hypothetical protein [Glaciimonas sp. PCH181]|uniref:hypothetical protein n=1 Tax=Glaciimonas sp. PCH181 TaxID=2133943 RepID=UPI000D38CF56|nr:hypothetical protein [Glaciimonas sp. PCH181]PUA18002.1 hypothetical protein C7W93_19385 [Glaciimonas sp. PCH181]
MEEEEPFKRITLRIPNALHAKLQTSAVLATHSQNAEIIARLTQTYEDARPTRLSNPDDFPVGELIQELIERYGPERICIRIGNPEIEDTLKAVDVKPHP